jgi:hypothetical protein
MKMGCILDGGAGETRSWHFGAASPIRKLILVHPRTDDCRLVSTQAKLVFPPCTSRWLPRWEHEVCMFCIRAVLA